MAQAISRLTRLRPREQFWIDHLRTARQQGQTLKAYAQTHGLSVSALYTARSTLKRRGVVSDRPGHRGPFWQRGLGAHLGSFLDRRVRDGVIRRAIGKWLNAGVMEAGELSYPKWGSPQGGVEVDAGRHGNVYNAGQAINPPP